MVHDKSEEHVLAHGVSEWNAEDKLKIPTVVLFKKLPVGNAVMALMKEDRLDFLLAMFRVDLLPVAVWINSCEKENVANHLLSLSTAASY
jgi:hypothetical protein